MVALLNYTISFVICKTTDKIELPIYIHTEFQLSTTISYGYRGKRETTTIITRFRDDALELRYASSKNIGKGMGLMLFSLALLFPNPLTNMRGLKKYKLFLDEQLNPNYGTLAL